MPLKTILFLGLFVTCTVGAVFFNPILGVLGYVAHYITGPDLQWWSQPIRHWGIRYSFALAIATAVGLALHYRRVRAPGKLLLGQEKLLLLFLAMVWLSTLIGPRTTLRFTTVDHPSVKFTKLAIFALMLSHVVAGRRQVNWLLWTMIVGSLILGLQAYTTPRRAFVGGRLEGVGGADFSDANRLAGFMGCMLFLIGVQFLRSKSVGKALCAIAGAFVANTVVLCRSRGALVAMAAGGIMAMFMAPRRYRGKILAGLVLAGAAFLYVTDEQFRSRALTISPGEKNLDKAAQMRLQIWHSALRMAQDRPWGVGAGNFYQEIGRYGPKSIEGFDAHNTYIRCLCELGVQGLAVFLALIANGILSLRRTIKTLQNRAFENDQDLLWVCYGAQLALVALLVYGLTGTVLYMESLWWLMVLPACLQRTVAAQALPKLENASDGQEEAGKIPSRRKRRIPTGGGRAGRDLVRRPERLVR